jgi:hypothetical protein
MEKVDSTELYDGIRQLVLSPRQTAARGVNLLQVHMNYEIGRRIVQDEQGGADRAQYGKEIIKELAARLTSDFGNGFSPRATSSTCAAATLHIRVETPKYPRRCLGDSQFLKKVRLPQLPRQRLGNLIPAQSFPLVSVGPITSARP